MGKAEVEISSNVTVLNSSLTRTQNLPLETCMSSGFRDTPNASGKPHCLQPILLTFTTVMLEQLQCDSERCPSSQAQRRQIDPRAGDSELGV